MAFDFDRVQKDIRGLREYLKRPSKHATPEQVHSLRTGIRRLEAGIEALALDTRVNEQRLLRKLSKLRGRAGKVRDLDVLTGYAAGVLLKGEEACQIELLEILGAEHARRSRQLHSFAMRNGEPLRRRLKRTATKLKSLSEDRSVGTGTSGEAMLAVLRVQRELTSPSRLTRNNLHPFRLKAKELRYMLQMKNDRASQATIEILGAMKDAIGEWHDWQQLLGIARKHLPHGSECKLVTVFQTTTDEKFVRALSIANAGRKHFQPAAANTERSRTKRRG
jgi:CHAD domain-containing protein